MAVKAQKAEEAPISRLAVFLENKSLKSVSTRQGYISATKQFMSYIYSDKDLSMERLDVLVEKYFSETRDHHKNFKLFVKTCLQDRPSADIRL